jgi:hypothetical protein
VDQKKLLLIRVWEELSEALFLDRQSLRAAQQVLPESLLARRRRFLNVFGDELDFVRAARNNVAHAKPLTGDEADEAITVGRRLLEAWQAEADELGFRRVDAEDDHGGMAG